MGNISEKEPRKAVLLRRIAEISATGGALVALTAWMLWITGKWQIGALGEVFVPMSPSTAILFILLCSAVFVRNCWPDIPATTVMALLASIYVAMASLMVLAGPIFGFEFLLERWLAPSSETLGGIQLGRMSLLTAFNFLLASLSFLLRYPLFGCHRFRRQLASLLALATLFIALAVLFSYAAGIPLLYGRNLIPMAILTAAAFILLGLSLLATADPDTWPRSLLETDTSSLPYRSSLVGPLFVLVLLVVTIASIGGSYLNYNDIRSRDREFQQLSSIADYRVLQISDWYKDVLRDSRVVSESPLFQEQATEFLAVPSDPRMRQKMLAWMKNQQKNYRYRQIVLYDAKGEPRLQTSQNLPSLPNKKTLNAALAGREMVVSDLQRDQELFQDGGQTINFNIWIPISVKPGQNRGVLLLQTDPHLFLYPLIQSWPAPSRSAETLLVRREGDQVVYLNELRHRPNTALTLRIPLSSSWLIPAVRAAKGWQGLMEGYDYRNVPVLAVVRTVKGTPWSMVAKKDREEIYAPLKSRAITLSLLNLVLIFASALGVGFVWQQNEAFWLRQKLQAEMARQALSERVLFLNKRANDIILLFDRDWHIMEANDSAVKAYGYTLEELRRMSLRELQAEATFTDPDDPEKRRNQSEDSEEVTRETVHRRRDGSLFPIELSICTVETGGERFHQSIIRDITERNRAEEKLRQSETQYRTLFNAMTEGFCIIEVLFDADDRPIDYRFLEVNPAFETQTGLRDAQGKLMRELAPEHEAYWFELYGKVALTGEPAHFEMDTKAPDHWYDVTAYRIDGQDSRKVAILFNNITEVKRGEAALRESHAALEVRVQERTAKLSQVNRELEAEVVVRKRTERELSEKEERLRFALDAIEAGEWDLNLIDHIVAVHSPQHDRIFGYQDLLPLWTYEMFLNHVLPADRDEVDRQFHQAIEERHNLGMEYRIVREDGVERWIRACGRNVLDEQGIPYRMVGIVEDITERKQAEESLRESEQKYQQLNETLEQRVKEAVDELRDKDRLLMIQGRHAAMGEMIGNIAHQWRQPLNMLGLLAQELPVFYKRGEFSAEYLNVNVEKTMALIHHMSKTIDDFTNFFQPDKQKIEFKVLEVIEKTMSLLEGSFKAHEIRTELNATGESSINGYPNELAQVLLIIFNNAKEALLAQKVASPTITIGLRTESGKTIVTISDNAGGIPEDIIDKLFNPYFTTKGPDKGTGIGLYMSKTIIEKHMNGILSVRNIGNGAEFRIEI